MDRFSARGNSAWGHQRPLRQIPVGPGALFCSDCASLVFRLPRAFVSALRHRLATTLVGTKCFPLALEYSNDCLIPAGVRLHLLQRVTPARLVGLDCDEPTAWQ